LLKNRVAKSMGEKSQESAQGPDMRRVLINHVNGFLLE
jgi:hypothetical protein